MLPQLVISMVLMFSITAIFVWFLYKNRVASRYHRQTVFRLKTAIRNNRKQISFRNSTLNLYDFLKYNLDEAMVSQPEIRF